MSAQRVDDSAFELEAIPGIDHITRRERFDCVGVHTGQRLELLGAKSAALGEDSCREIDTHESFAFPQALELGFVSAADCAGIVVEYDATGHRLASSDVADHEAVSDADG